MMEQYFRIKEDHQDALLFFRLGDFYEMFYEDAEKASSVLEIALTSRQKVPMCGVPYHAAESYLVKLIKHGFKVAICEQVEDPKAAKGVVKRDVVKVLTPGTAVELDAGGTRENIYIAALLPGKDEWGLAVIDLASGRINCSQHMEGEKRNLGDDLFKMFPKEVVYPQEEETRIQELLVRNDISAILKSPIEDWAFDPARSKSQILRHFKVRSLAGLGLEGRDKAIGAAGGLLTYLKKLRRDSLSLVHKISFRESGGRMILDAATVKNLELVRNLRDGRRDGSFLDIIDFSVTAVGARLLRSWLLQPLLHCESIEARLDTVEELAGKTMERHQLRESLADMRDLERLTGKISLAAAHPRDCVSLKKSLRILPGLRTQLTKLKSTAFKKMAGEWDNLEDIADLVDKAILEEPAFLLTEGRIIKDGYNTELDDLREISRSGKTFITNLEKKEKQRTGITSLKVRYNKVFGYYIEVTKPNLSQVPPDYMRKQTLVNSERFITPELKEYEEKVLNAEEKIGDLEYSLFLEVRDKIAGETSRLLRMAGEVAHCDVYSALAELAVRRGYFRPRIGPGNKIHIQEGRHPVIEMTQSEPFIPNDTYLDADEDQILIITGPNMGGKSTYLRQVALICILAQMGSFVPAKKAEIGLVDRIFTRIGAMDFLSIGQSTFMVEMIETANILNNTTPKSLILLDEVGRGTSTFDGLSIAWAVAEFLHENEEARPKTLFATHYHELTELALTLKRIKNYHVSVKERKDDIIFLRKILPGPSDQSYGIHVAKLAGVPQNVVSRAREILFNLEKKELDGSGRPRIAYRSSAGEHQKNQLFLFQEDRDQSILKEIRAELEKCDINSMSPLEALNFLNKLRKKIKV